MRATTAHRLAEKAGIISRATRSRDALILKAIAEGGSLRAIAAAAGVSHQTVSNIAKKENSK